MSRPNSIPTLTLYVKDEGKAQRVSPHFRDLIAKNVSQHEILAIRRGKKSIDEVIAGLGYVNKDKDPKAYHIYHETLEFLSGDYKMNDSYSPITITSHLDCSIFFNTQDKVSNFLLHMMNFIMDNKINGHIPVVLHESFIIIDFRLWLEILENYVVEEFRANRDDVKNFFVKNLLLGTKLSYLINGIFGYEYKLLGTDFTYTMRKKRAWTDSVNEDDLGNEFVIRGITFSTHMFERRLNKMEEKGVEHPFNFEKYADFLEYIKEGELRQICFSTVAANSIRKRRESGNPIPEFYRYGRSEDVEPNYNIHE